MAYTDNDPMPIKIMSGSVTVEPDPDSAREVTLASLAADIADMKTDIAAMRAVAESTTPGAVVADITAMRHADVTLTLDTAQYADGDLFFENILVADAARVINGDFACVGVKVFGEDDQGQPFDLLFHNTSSDWGTLNAAPTISDADARAICGRVQIATADYYDLGGMRFADKFPLYVAMTPVTGSRDIRISGISRGTGTYTANGMRLRLYFQ